MPAGNTAERSTCSRRPPSRSRKTFVEARARRHVPERQALSRCGESPAPDARRRPDQRRRPEFLGYMLANNNDRLDEAIRLVNQALQKDPGNGAYLDSLGWAHFKKGNLDRGGEVPERSGRQAAEERRSPRSRWRSASAALAVAAGDRFLVAGAAGRGSAANKDEITEKDRECQRQNAKCKMTARAAVAPRPVLHFAFCPLPRAERLWREARRASGRPRRARFPTSPPFTPNCPAPAAASGR